MPIAKDEMRAAAIADPHAPQGFDTRRRAHRRARVERLDVDWHGEQLDLHGHLRIGTRTTGHFKCAKRETRTRYR
jgi:hypothetical protein